MTREEAQRECKRLVREHPDRDRFEWLPRERDGCWEVVRVPLPEGIRRTGEIREETKPPPVAPPADPDSGERARREWWGGAA